MNSSNLTYLAGNSSAFDDMAAVYNAANGLDNPDHIDLDGDYFRQSYSHPSIDIGRDLIIVRTKGKEAIAFGAIMPGMSKTNSSVLLTMFVHPEYRRKGIGSQLLSRLITIAQNRGARRVNCSVPSFRAPTSSFLEKHGFEPLRQWIKLVHQDLNHIEHQTQSCGLAYKIIEEEDANAWAALQNSLFSGSFNYTEVTGEEFVHMAQFDTFCRDLALFGVHNGRTVAYCVGTLLGPTGSPTHERRLIIDGIGVVTRQRRQGFARAILNEVLTRAAALGVTRSELIVDGHNDPAIRMYRSAGYRESYRRIWYEHRLT